MGNEWLEYVFYGVFLAMQVMLIYVYNETIAGILKKDKRWYLYLLVTLCALVFYALLHAFMAARLGFQFSLLGSDVDIQGGAVFHWLAFAFLVLLVTILITVFKNLWSVLRRKSKMDKRWYGLELLAFAVCLAAAIALSRVDYRIPFSKELDPVYIGTLAVLLAAIWISLKSLNLRSEGPRSGEPSGASGDGHYEAVLAEYDRLQRLGDHAGQVALLLKETAAQTDAARKAKIWNLLGLAYKNLGDDARSLECYQTAMKLAPSSAGKSGEGGTPQKPAKEKRPPKAKKPRAAGGKGSAKPNYIFDNILILISIGGLLFLVFSSVRNAGGGKLPSDYTIVDGRTWVSAREELDAALLRMDENVCYRGVITSPVEWLDILHGDYTHFWVKNFSYSDVQRRKFPGEDKEEAYRIYHFEYYDVTPDQIAAMKREIDAACEDIFSQIPADADDWETARVIHDEMVKRISFDHSLSEPFNNNAYGALVRHSAVCCGYSVTYKYLLLRRGINADATQSDDHAWNFFYLPAEDPYVDVTWDDPDRTDANGDPYILHDYFFLTKDEINAIDSHAFKYFQASQEQAYDSLTPYNYHVREGCLLDRYDQKACEQIFREQLRQGGNVLTVRFATEEAFQEALTWPDNDYKVFLRIMQNIGYNGSTMLVTNEKLRIVNVLLYPPAA
ncbi:MAG: tetratricopeptide repeat protein [Oscillospiraceae bacterium]|nr:tetratricopeptide repeat protein [Oscillospiraceae bacterium]